MPSRTPRTARYFVYFLRCADASLYIGYTTDLARRLAHHNTSKRGARYTRGRRPVVLKYFESFRTLSAALQREHALKRLTRAQKLALIKSAKLPKKPAPLSP
jgi:putative endonuclease